MTNAVRISSQRPLLVAVGPSAARLIERDHRDLELVDVLVVDGAPSHDEMRWLAATHSLERSFTVVVFDAQDETFWATACMLVREARVRTTHPVWFVCPDSRGARARSRMLTNLARELDACVIDPGVCDALDVALLSAAAMCRTGVIGIDSVELATVAHAGAIGLAKHDRDLTADASAEGVFIVMRCSNEVTLHSINEATLRIANHFSEDANVILAAPMHPYVTLSAMEICVLTFSNLLCTP